MQSALQKLSRLHVNSIETYFSFFSQKCSADIILHDRSFLITKVPSHSNQKWLFQTGGSDVSNLKMCLKKRIKVIVTVKLSGCLQISFGPLIIICNFFIWPPLLQLIKFKKFKIVCLFYLQDVCPYKLRILADFIANFINVFSSYGHPVSEIDT